MMQCVRRGILRVLNLNLAFQVPMKVYRIEILYAFVHLIYKFRICNYMVCRPPFVPCKNNKSLIVEIKKRHLNGEL